MLNEEVIKQFFLISYEEEKKLQIEESQEIIHAKKLSSSKECWGDHLFYKHLWLEEEVKSQNAIQKVGLITVSAIEQTLWIMSYDGWCEKNEKICIMENLLLIKTLPPKEGFGGYTISGATKDKLLSYIIRIDGRFQLFESKTTIFPTNRRHMPVFHFTYRGRALVNLSV